MARDQIHFWCLGWRKTISSWDCSVVAARNERTVRTPRSRNNGFGIPTPQRLKYRAAHSCYSLPSSFVLATKPSMKLLLSCEDYSNFHKKDKSEKKKNHGIRRFTQEYLEINRNNLLHYMEEKKWASEMDILLKTIQWQRLKSRDTYPFLVQNHFYYITAVIMIWVGKSAGVGFQRKGRESGQASGKSLPH